MLLIMVGCFVSNIWNWCIFWSYCYCLK